MSYCRFSSDDCQSDVYVYEDVNGGWTTHVAANKHVFAEPLPVPVDEKNFEAWWEREKKVSAIVSKSPVVPLGLTYDGQSFNDDSPEECAETLMMLRRHGYRVPQYAIDALTKEAKDNHET